MSYKLLMEILSFEDEKQHFSEEEQQQIENELKKRTKHKLQKLGDKIISSIDYINDH